MCAKPSCCQHLYRISEKQKKKRQEILKLCKSLQRRKWRRRIRSPYLKQISRSLWATLARHTFRASTLPRRHHDARSAQWRFIFIFHLLSVVKFLSANTQLRYSCNLEINLKQQQKNMLQWIMLLIDFFFISGNNVDTMDGASPSWWILLRL